MLRTIVRIDEEKCDGCGACVPSCAEGAIQVIDGKARLVSEIYCDGLGACLGECPRGAISLEEREAEAYDEEAVEEHLKSVEGEEEKNSAPVKEQLPCGCPGSASRVIDRSSKASAPHMHSPRQAVESTLTNWPVQIKLLPLEGPYFKDAHLLIAADCVPFAFADFHSRLLEGRTLLIGCPKLDDAEFYMNKLTEIFKRNDIKSIGVAYMEVPCCFGLVHLVKMALAKSGKEIRVSFTKLGIQGDELEEVGKQAVAAR